MNFAFLCLLSWYTLIKSLRSSYIAINRFRNTLLQKPATEGKYANLWYDTAATFASMNIKNQAMHAYKSSLAVSEADKKGNFAHLSL